MEIKTSRIVILILVVVIPAILIFRNPINLGLDLRGGTSVVLEAQEEDGKKLQPDTMDKVREIVQRRVDGLGVSEPVIQKSGENRLIVELAGVKNAQEAIDLIGTTAKLEFKIKTGDNSYGPAVLDGSAIKNAYVQQDQFGKPMIGFELNDEGAVKFAEITRTNMGKQLAIMLDGKEQSAPVIQSEIPGGKGSISGSFTYESAQNLANLLKAGALPVNIQIMETRSVDASLGAESIKATKMAAMIALVLVSLFMLVVYRVAGFVADLALCVFGILTAGLMCVIGTTLTLPGIAGFILSLGMAVDANVIIFERIKDEIMEGKRFQDCIDDGFNRAFPAILDGNITTLLITMVLFFFGTGPVRGFAVILTIGVLVSMFTAIFITKIIVKIFVNIFHLNGKKLFGLKGVE
ncbi:MAG: protein translocase subunit SecD [Fusobacteriales bacterium]|jgi:preprotein translocase subunit SecD|nr:protein translocase subunit SecD [Fusobacteriales bacterium]